MTADAYAVLVAVIAIVLLAASAAAAFINAIGEERVARLLHLPWGNDQ